MPNTATNPKQINVPHFRVSGLRVRTCNRDEYNQSKAKIAGLWADFFSQSLDTQPERIPDSPIFGVYSDYETDANGYFDVTAGVSVPTDTEVPGLHQIDIAAGKYLVFERKGTMPAAVIEAWGAIWLYFQQHPEVTRCFHSDFESYLGPEEVQVYIGVE